MSTIEQQIDQILDTLVHDLESSIHAFYRGDVRQQTARVKTGSMRSTARDALLPLVGAARATGNVGSVAADAASFAPDEVAAITRCIMAWMPMGPPTTASPQSRCVSAAKEVSPTWGEREKARLAVRRASA